MIQKFDVAILGGGPAGLSAAIYSARYGMKTIVIAREIGGAANYASKIENYPGYIGSGKNLMRRFYRQAKKFGTEFLEDDLIGIKKEEGFEIITGRKMKIATGAVIIALGTQKNKLNIKGEDKFLGRGVSYCATCDGNFFRNKTVAVIGGGNSALHASQLMSGLAKKVYALSRGKFEGAEEKLLNEVRNLKNVELMNDTIPMEIKGKDSVREIVITSDGKGIPKLKSLKVDGVFIEIGSMPVSDICRALGIKTDKEGYIEVDINMETNSTGIFAAGDVVKTKLKQVIVAASQGAKAAKSAYEFIKSN